MKLVCLLFILKIYYHGFSQEITGAITKVTDGDSFELLSGNQVTKIRLNGIDCPEINQPYGDSARNYLLLYLNDTVSVVVRDIDKYGRTVGDVFYQDTLVNYRLVELGLAWHYKKYSTEEILSSAEQEAKSTLVGLWKDESPIAPWDWRSGNFERSILQANSEIKYFICIGKENTTYHTIHFCKELKSCNSSTILVTQPEAQQVYSKESCPFCIPSTN